jgi:hypothetical protein
VSLLTRYLPYLRNATHCAAVSCAMHRRLDITRSLRHNATKSHKIPIKAVLTASFVRCTSIGIKQGRYMTLITVQLSFESSETFKQPCKGGLYATKDHKGMLCAVFSVGFWYHTSACTNIRRCDRIDAVPTSSTKDFY